MCICVYVRMYVCRMGYTRTDMSTHMRAHTEGHGRIVSQQRHEGQAESAIGGVAAFCRMRLPSLVLRVPRPRRDLTGYIAPRT